jgi:tRNA/tmRNA/rRNA uracil-C5-methylase (TrmA/RlmC/RlmD family)
VTGAAGQPPVEQPESLVGHECELDVGAVAHGGHCVARWDGRVVFVRHTLPGERVRVRITEGDSSSRFLRADAVEVLVAGAGRVARPCPYAGPGRCGGCDFQHVDPVRQRELLGNVLAEQLSRLGGVQRLVDVQPVEPDALHWRTRMGWTVGPDGVVGLRRHRSHEVEPVDRCLIAAPAHPAPAALEPSVRPGAERIDSVVSSSGEQVVLVDGLRTRGPSHVTEDVHGRAFRVTGSGFWQGHPAAATVLVDAVLELGRPVAGERAVDLYSGVGLFSAFLGERVGPDGAVVSVETDSAAVRDARRNLHDQPHVEIVQSRVEQALRGWTAPDKELRADLVVLDPPRTGAKARVVRGIAALRPSRVVYVACDPAALGRDVATFAELGYTLRDVRGFDLFPMTHHVEAVALLERAASADAAQ